MTTRQPRPVDEIARENLKLIVEACSKRLGRSQGGQTYLAALLGKNLAPHISALVNGKRKLGSLKDSIESTLNLSPGWMDREHDESVVEEISRKLPSMPRRQNKDIQSPPTATVRRLENTVADLQQQLDELRSQLASKSSTRK